MLNIHSIRHGQTDWNHRSRFQGQQDIPLNELGQRQAQAVATRLKHPPLAAMYASDLCRAHGTAEIINAHHGLSVVKDAALRERCFGCFEGFTTEPISRRFPGIRAAYEQDKLNFRIPGGESRLDLIHRVGGFFEQLSERHPEETIAVVSHGGVLGALFSAMISQKLGLDSPKYVPLFSVENCSISRLAHKDGQWLVQSLNQTGHLEGLTDIRLERSQR